MSLLLFAACAAPTAVGDFVVTTGDDGALTVATSEGKILVRDLRFAVGDGDEAIEMQAGAYRLEGGDTAWITAVPEKGRGDGAVLFLPLVDGQGDELGNLSFEALGPRLLSISAAGTGNRLRWDAGCTGDDAFAGLGSHVDVDHAGEAFPLWMSEPGIGKSEHDSPPDDWFLTGTRHASSFPDPFLVRAEPMGLAIATLGRVETDLCTGDRWRLDAWDAAPRFLLFDGDSTLDIVAAHARAAGEPAIPPDWAFAPWNDAVGGSDRVRAVVNELRTAGAPASVVWTEDWKGGEETAFGYRLLAEWDLDTALYPDAPALDAELEAAGFKWLAYFAPFVSSTSAAWSEASAFVMRTEDDEPYLFTGVDFDPTGALDVTDEDARDWAEGKMAAAIAVGFDGWMTDYGEWVPPDGVLASADAMRDHNGYPGWWQTISASALADTDGVFFSRSGWTGTSTVSPVTWVGDQRTSFDADDGFPTVVPLAIGASIAGVPMVTHDIGGYQSIGNAPSTKELWFRWCALGAFSPIMRTHHGAFLDDNWQFDSDAETLAHYARYARVHAELFPYLRGLAERARSTGVPLVLAPFLVFPDEPWNRTDAWMLGSSLFVVPVTTGGATSVQIALPGGAAWYDWWTGAPAASGNFDAPIDAIPVFAPAGAIVPLYTEAPDSLVEGPLDGITTRTDADAARTIRVFAGAAGSFTEADGTRYSTDGSAASAGTSESTLTTGSITAGGLVLSIEGTVERTYRLDVYR